MGLVIMGVVSAQKTWVILGIVNAGKRSIYYMWCVDFHTAVLHCLEEASGSDALVNCCTHHWSDC